MIEVAEVVKNLYEAAALVGMGGVVGFMIRQDRRITRTETLTADLVGSVKELTQRLDKIVEILLEKPWQSN